MKTYIKNTRDLDSCLVCLLDYLQESEIDFEIVKDEIKEMLKVVNGHRYELERALDMARIEDANECYEYLDGLWQTL